MRSRHASRGRSQPFLNGRLRVQPVPPDARLEADPDRLEQALVNLLQNAAVHTPEGTAVELRVSQARKAWLFEVEDRGQGLARGREDEAFERFVHGPASQRIRSRPRRGQEHRARARGRGRRRQPSRGGGDVLDPDPTMTVLLVEDEDRIASFVTKGLGARGFDVRRVSTGGDAQTVATDDVGVVVLDLGLPDIDGLEVLRRLRERSPRLPVVILTARGDIEDRVRGLDLGADDYVAKPFAIDELAARLRARLRPRADHAVRLTVGELELDLIARRARVGERVIWLTPREFALLEMLMRHAGTTVTRRELLSEVWSLDFDPRSNLVDVYVRYLRRKLGSGWITTERGVGYRIVEPNAEAGTSGPKRSAPRA